MLKVKDLKPRYYQLDPLDLVELRRVAKPEGVMGRMVVNPSVD